MNEGANKRLFPFHPDCALLVAVGKNVARVIPTARQLSRSNLTASQCSGQTYTWPDVSPLSARLMVSTLERNTLSKSACVMWFPLRWFGIMPPPTPSSPVMLLHAGLKEHVERLPTPFPFVCGFGIARHSRHVAFNVQNDFIIRQETAER